MKIMFEYITDFVDKPQPEITTACPMSISKGNLGVFESLNAMIERNNLIS